MINILRNMIEHYLDSIYGQAEMIPYYLLVCTTNFFEHAVTKIMFFGF